MKKKALHKSSIISGAMVSLANPYWIIWWATIGMGYLMSAIKSGIAGVGAFFIGHILADLAWYSLVSFGISKGKKNYEGLHLPGYNKTLRINFNSIWGIFFIRY